MRTALVFFLTVLTLAGCEAQRRPGGRGGGGGGGGNKDATVNNGDASSDDGGSSDASQNDAIGSDAFSFDAISSDGGGLDAVGFDAFTPDVPIGGCPLGSEGCPCNAGSCNGGLTCAEWPALNPADPILTTCVTTCTDDNGCSGSTLGSSCKNFFVNTQGLIGICLSRQVGFGDFDCSGVGGPSAMIGCAPSDTCLTNLRGSGNGLCATLCGGTAGTCSGATPFCNPRGSGLVDGANPIGVCAARAIGSGELCNRDDPTRSCDTTLTEDMICLGVPGLAAPEGFCVEACRLADNICNSSDPGSGPYTCVPALPNNTTFGICSAECSSFPDTCSGLGGNGAGRTCSQSLQFTGGNSPMTFCFDVLTPTWAEAHFRVVNGMTQQVAGTGDNCSAEHYRCPNGTFCADSGGNGLCVRGCSSAMPPPFPNGGCQLNNNPTPGQTCFASPNIPSDNQVCVDP